MDLLKKEFIFKDVNNLKGVGIQLSKYLKRKKIEKIKDILLNLPYSTTDRSRISHIKDLEVGKIQTIKVFIKKINFPRVRNLPNIINCEDETGKINIVYFNSREGYLRKLFTINKQIVVSGKINFFRNRFQITNPDYVTNIENESFVTKKIPKYNLTKGINEKKYRFISEQVTNNLPYIEDWLDSSFIKKNSLISWNEAIKRLHHSTDSKNNNSLSYRRLVFDEIFANFLTLSENRKRIKKQKIIKNFKNNVSNSIIEKLPFILTKSQIKVLNEINLDLRNSKRMFRIIQGDVGSGKTIISLLAAINVVESGYQCALMAPTEILAYQHYKLAKEIFKKLNININFLTGKTEKKIKKKLILILKVERLT